MKAIERLQAMIGKTWMFNAKTVKLQSYHKDETGKITIQTDKSHIYTRVEELPGFLNQFLEVEQEEEYQNQAIQLQVVQETRSGLSELRSVLMDNIKQLQKDKEFIHQARAINNNVNTMINMVKLEFQITKELKNKK